MKYVLFVCFHNAGRSQMAEAFFNQMAKERNPPFFAKSSGTVPARAINPVAVEAMNEIGISMERQSPKALWQVDIDRAEIVITMHCVTQPERCPTGVGRTEDWDLVDPAGQPIETVRRVRDEIKVKVSDLLDRLTAESAAPNATGGVQ